MFSSTTAYPISRLVFSGCNIVLELEYALLISWKSVLGRCARLLLLSDSIPNFIPNSKNSLAVQILFQLKKVFLHLV